MTKKNSRIPVLKPENGELISDTYEKAETLNKFFSNRFNTCEIPLSERDRDLFTTFSLDCPQELLCTEDDILKLLYSLDITKANGPDDMSATVLKATAPTIANGVMISFNKSIELGEVPKEWKTSSVVPIPKGNDTCQPSNYRPISLLSVLSKLLERHLYKHILKHMESTMPLACSNGDSDPVVPLYQQC